MLRIILYVLIATSPVTGQIIGLPPWRRAFSEDIPRYVHRADIQQQLGLSQPQIDELQRFVNEIRARANANDDDATNRNLTGTEQSVFWYQKWAEQTRFANSKVKTILSKKQWNDAKVLVLKSRFQTHGLAWVLHSEDIEPQLADLNISDDDFRQIETAAEQQHKLLFAKLSESSAKLSLEMAAIQRTIGTALMSVFTDSQQSLFKEVLGKSLNDVDFEIHMANQGFSALPELRTFELELIRVITQKPHDDDLLDEQRKELDIIGNQLRSEMFRAAETAEDLAAEDQLEYRRDRYNSATKVARPKIENVLLTHQLQRAKQQVLLDRLRIFGLRPFVESHDVDDRLLQLRVTGQQYHDLEKVINQHQPALKAKFVELRKIADEQDAMAMKHATSTVYLLLTPSQRSKLTAILGIDPMELPYRPKRPGLGF